MEGRGSEQDRRQIGYMTWGEKERSDGKNHPRATAYITVGGLVRGDVSHLRLKGWRIRKPDDITGTRDRG